VPQIVERVVAPHLTSLVASVWNPLSLRQTDRLAAAARYACPSRAESRL
jgi:hypothetical protein